MDPFDDCLNKGRLRAVEPDPDTIMSEMLVAREELGRARSRSNERRYEDCLVQSYFAMFRAAKALLRKRGYKDTNLYSLLVGLRKLYVETGDLEAHHVSMLSSGKEQKDLVYEGARCSPRDTRALLRNSEVFLGKAVKLLGLESLFAAHEFESPGGHGTEREAKGGVGGAAAPPRDSDDERRGSARGARRGSLRRRET